MWTEIKIHNVRAMSFSLIWGLTKDYSLGDSLSALRNCSEEVDQYICDLGKGVHALEHTSW